MGSNQRPKYAKGFWTRLLFSGDVQQGNSLRREFNIQDGSGFRNIFRMTKSDFEIFIQAIGHRTQKKDTKFLEAILPTITLAVTLQYLASGDFSLNFNSTDFMFCNKIHRVIFLITVFLICTTHIP